MNRRDRRIANKKAQTEPEGRLGTTPLPMAPVVGDPGKPGLVLRIVSHVLLSKFVLKRINHPQVLGILRDVAQQAGRMDAMVRIQAKLQAPNDR